MRQQPIKRLEEISPRPAEAEGLVEQLLKHLEAINPGPGEAQALGKRMQHGTSSESDRQRLMEILQAEDAALVFLASWNPPSLPSQGHRRAKRQQQMVKRLRRRHRRERRGGEAGQRVGAALHPRR